MYQFYNAHPRGLLVGDCVKRAISKAANMDYMEVQKELNRYKKVTGAKSFNSDYNPHKYVENVLHGVKIMNVLRRRTTFSTYFQHTFSLFGIRRLKVNRNA